MRTKQRVRTQAFDGPSIRSAVVGAVRGAIKDGRRRIRAPTADILAKRVETLARKANALAHVKATAVGGVSHDPAHLAARPLARRVVARTHRRLELVALILAEP